MAEHDSPSHDIAYTSGNIIDQFFQARNIRRIAASEGLKKVPFKQQLIDEEGVTLAYAYSWQRRLDKYMNRRKDNHLEGLRAYVHVKDIATASITTSKKAGRLAENVWDYVESTHPNKERPGDRYDFAKTGD